MMAASLPPMDDWRSLNKRQIVIQKLEEHIKALGNPPANLQNPVEVEKSFFEKSKTKEEYQSCFHNVILMLTRLRQKQNSQGPQGGPMMNPVRPNPHNMMGPGQPMGMNQPAPGYQQPFNQYGGMGGQVSNPGYPSNMGVGMGGPQRGQQPPQYGMYPAGGNPTSGMHIQQQQRFPGNMPQGFQQGRPMPSSNYPADPHNISVMGGGGGGSGGGYNTVGMPFNRPMPHGAPMMRPGMMPAGIQNRQQYMHDRVGMQPVQAVPNPSYASSIRPSSMTGPTYTSASTIEQLPQTSLPPSSIPDSGNVPPSGGAPQDGLSSHPLPSVPGTSTAGANPPTPHIAPLQGPVPSPAPPTPLYPASPATSGIGSPATQPTMTPEENEAYIRKLGELQKFVPLMSKWIDRLGRDNRKNDQHSKLKNLYNLLLDTKRRVPLPALIKCGQALERMFEKESSVQPKNPPVPSTSSSSSSTAPPIHNEPVVPEPKFSNPPQSQSLLDFKMVHSPPASCVTLMETVQPHPLPAERLPAAKRLCTREEPPLPPNVIREMAHLKQFGIQVLEKKDKFDKSITLECSLVDEDLPTIPTLTVTLPPSYPSVSPICDLTHYQNESSSPFLKEVGNLLSEKLSKRSSVYSFSTLLDSWEMCILRTLAKELMVQEE